MKQVAQRLRNGRIEVLEVPPPVVSPAGVLVDVRASLLSAGTERSKVEAGRQSLVGKARSRPDQVQQVLQKAKREGIRDTIEAVRSRLDSWSDLGYSAAGVATEVGSRVRDIVPGDRVACAGGGFAVHGEIDNVPGNLCVPLPPAVNFEAGAFGTVGSIALHGVRQADVRIGEKVAVIGLGLIGQLSGQILRAAACQVVGIDLSRENLDRALELGAVDAGYSLEQIAAAVPEEATGCDAVLITAATRSSDPIRLAAELARDRGRVVVVGDVGMELPRAPYYGKELELRLSRSYGPGRYDREYEERGLDYPVGYVRWTERRNMAAFLDLVAKGKVDVSGLVTERVPIEDAASAYERLTSDSGTPFGIVLQSPHRLEPAAEREPARAARPALAADPLSAGVIGAGGFAQKTLIPGLRRAGFALTAVASASGLSARSAADRLRFARVASPGEVLADPEVGLAVVATRHGSHAVLASAALRAGKAVFLEKPPCLTLEELGSLREARESSGQVLAVGFNRRHASLAEQLRSYLSGHPGSVELLYRVSAGPLPPGHWLNDLEEGGGRLLGEGCHFLDFVCWGLGKLPERVSCTMGVDGDLPLAAAQRFTVLLEFEDGSLGTVAYLAGGAASLGKERVEAHAAGRSAVLEDFRSLTLHGEGRPRTVRSRSQDKGHDAQLRHLREILEGRGEPTTPDPLDTMAVTLAALRAAETGTSVSMSELLEPNRH